MPRNLMVSRYDWGQDPLSNISGGTWETQLPSANMLRIQAQVVAQAIGSSVTFALNFATVQSIGAVHLQRLVADPTGTIDIPGFTSGPVSVLPTGMDALTFAALGRPRVFIPSAAVLTNTIAVTITGATTPLQIGYIGACEMIELPVNMEFNWKIVQLDESDVQRTPFGSTYIVLRGKRHRLNLGVGFIRQGGIYGNAAADQIWPIFDAAVIAGRSFPILAAPLPDDIDNLERIAVWGTSTTDQEFANDFFATWHTAYQIDQLI